MKLGHIGLPVTDIKKAMKFYDALAPVSGLILLEAHDDFVGYGSDKLFEFYIHTGNPFNSTRVIHDFLIQGDAVVPNQSIVIDEAGITSYGYENENWVPTKIRKALLASMAALAAWNDLTPWGVCKPKKYCSSGEIKPVLKLFS